MINLAKKTRYPKSVLLCASLWQKNTLFDNRNSLLAKKTYQLNTFIATKYSFFHTFANYAKAQ